MACTLCTAKVAMKNEVSRVRTSTHIMIYLSDAPGEVKDVLLSNRCCCTATGDVADFVKTPRFVHQTLTSVCH